MTEHLPVEVVGHILSLAKEVRPVVAASAACRKWRQAFREHLVALSFSPEDWPGSKDRDGSEVEALITRTILQTTSVQSLKIETHIELSVPAVMSWLRHTRESLRVFHFDADFDADYKDPALNVVEICGWEKLEELTLSHAVIQGVNPDCHRFASLRSLSLNRCFRISEPDLSALLNVCPNLEALDVIFHDDEKGLDSLKVVAPPNIRRIRIMSTILDELILESDGVEHLHLDILEFELFKFIGKDTLKNIAVHKAFLHDIDISDSAENLETIDVSDSRIPQPELILLISKSSKLKTLRLWDNEMDRDVWVEPTDLEFIAASCPLLSHLSLGCNFLIHNLSDDDELFLPYCLGGSTRFENVIYLKVGWSRAMADESLDAFFDLVEGLLERCPSLKKLVIDGIIRGLADLIGQEIARFTTRIFQVLRKCIDSNVQFDFDK